MFRFAQPPALLEEWVSLYGTLVERYGITGIRAFSRTAFAKQLTLPGMVALRAERRGTTVAANLFLVQGTDRVRSSDRGEPGRLRVSCLVCPEMGRPPVLPRPGALDRLGGRSGATADHSDGLGVFKQGWAQTTRPAYFCGRIFDRETYDHLVQAGGSTETTYFPAYRAGEFQ